MGISMSTPEPIKLQIHELGNSQCETLVVDSMNFDNQYEWIAKACLALNADRKRKIVFKLNRMKGKLKKMNEAIGKVMAWVDGLCFYGDSLICFEDEDWENYWKNGKTKNLAIKDKITGPGLINLCNGLMDNKSLEELTLGYLVLSNIAELNKVFKKNNTIKKLNIICDSRVANDRNSDESVNSSAPSTNHSIQGFTHLLNENSGVTEYSLMNYLENCPFLILGLISNRSVQRLVLENIDVDRETLTIWTETFKRNHSIKELEIRRGLNTSAAITILNSLKHSRHITSIKLQECTFGESGFMVLQDLLRENTSIKKLEIKDLMRLRYNNESSIDMQNFLYIISGLTDNSSITESVISIHSHITQNSSPFTQKVSKSLMELAKMNNFLIHLKIEGFKLSGNDICDFLQGLQHNKTMESCSLIGNLVEWKDLCYIINLVGELEVLKLLDLQDNKILTFTDLENLKGRFIASQSLPFIRESFLLISKGIRCEVRINQWFYDPMCYPNDIQYIVKMIKK